MLYFGGIGIPVDIFLLYNDILHRIKPVSFEVLRLRIQRVISENRVYRAVYRNNLSLLPTQMIEEVAKDSTLFNSEQPKQQSDKKWRKRIHRLQQQLQQMTDQLAFYRKEYEHLQYGTRSLRKQLANHSIIPQIQLKFDFMYDIQQQQLHIIDTMFQENQLLLCETPDDIFSRLLMKKLDIPSILHLSILRKYSLFVHTSRAARSRLHMRKNQNRNSGTYTIPNNCCLSSKQIQNSNPSLYLSTSELEFGANICCVEHQSFIDWWKLSFLGYDKRERLFQSLSNNNTVTFESIKQLICDYLYWNETIQIAIHDAYQTSSANSFVMCYHHYIYLTTVAAAILFSLNGLTSTMVGKREFMHSGLYSVLQLLDKKPIAVILPFAPSYSQQIFTRFQSLCEPFDMEILGQPCSTCIHYAPNFDSQFVISASKLMDSMSPKLSILCFNRAFTKINALLGYPDGAQIHYESYAMFNILYNVVNYKHGLA